MDHCGVGPDMENTSRSGVLVSVGIEEVVALIGVGDDAGAAHPTIRSSPAQQTIRRDFFIPGLPKG